MLNCKSIGHTTLFDTLVQVSFCIDEAIAAEMASKKVQSSMMDGQSPQVFYPGFDGKLLEGHTARKHSVNEKGSQVTLMCSSSS